MQTAGVYLLAALSADVWLAAPDKRVVVDGRRLIDFDAATIHDRPPVRAASRGVASSQKQHERQYPHC